MTLDDIKSRIEDSIPNSTAYILDPMNDGQHLQAIVISPAFEGLMLLKQHRMVKDAMKDALKDEAVHALSLKTFTQDKWDQEKHKYNL